MSAPTDPAARIGHAVLSALRDLAPANDAPRWVDLAAERRLVAVASEVRATLTTGYELARGGSVEALRALRALLSAALVGPVRFEQPAPRGLVQLTGTVSPTALLIAQEGGGGMVATPTGPAHTPMWVRAIRATG